MRTGYWFAACLLLGGLSAGCSDSPTPPTPVPNSTLIIGGVPTLEEGDTGALTLSVRVPSGALEAVAEDAAVTWSSSNTAVATVSNRGVVTALQQGSTTITASFDRLSTTAFVTVRPYGQIYRGSVGRVPDQFPVPDATIAVVDAKGRTQSVRADASSVFSVRLASGPVRFTVSAPGYETAELFVDTSKGVSYLLFGVLPIGFGVREQFGVPWEDWHGPIPGLPARQVIVPIVVNQPGTIRMRVEACVEGCLASHAASVCVEIRDSRNNVVSSARGIYDIMPRVPNIQTTGGERYEIKVGVCPSDRTEMMRQYYIDVTHPK